MSVAAAVRLLIVLIVAMAAVTVPFFLFPTQWRFSAVEQALLAPWLGPKYLGDGRPASEIILCYPMGLALNKQGELLISDRGRARKGRVVWRIDSDGLAHIIAGTGRRGTASEKSALRLNFERPEGLAVARDGSIFVSDGYNHSVFRIDIDGNVTRLAGTGRPGFGGDGGMAFQAMLYRPADIRLDSEGNLFIADVRNHRVRKVDASGRITTVAGTGEQGLSPDGTVATNARLDTPWGILIDREDRLIIADSGNHRVRRVAADGRLVTIAGSGVSGYEGDGGMAIDARLNFPEALFMLPDGKLYIGDEFNHAVRVVDTNGVISTVIGTGHPGRAKIGGRASGAAVNDPESVLVTATGEVIISDGNNGRVLRLSDDGIVHNLAGRGDTEPCTSLF